MLRVVEKREKKRVVGRVGSKPIPIARGVEITIAPGNEVSVKGPLGTLSQAFHPDMVISIEEDVLTVARPSDQRHHRALHGLTRALLYNMVVGVSEGYQRALELVGMGYRAQQDGQKVVLQVGYSHPVNVDPPAGITLTVESPIRISVSGCDKQQVGQVAADIRAVRKPDAYKGKGIRYAGEEVRLKPGKAAARK